MRAARIGVAIFALAGPSGCALFGFDLGDYGGPGADGTADSGDGGSTGDTTVQDGAEGGPTADGADTSLDEGADSSADGRADGGTDAQQDAQQDTGLDAKADAPTDSNGVDAPDTSPPPCTVTTYKRVFVSSQTYTATSIASLAAADMTCDDLALAAGIIEPSFKAWLSDDVTSAAARITHNSTDAYVLMDATTVVACNWNELVNVPHRHGIDKNELGTVVPTSPGCGGVTDRAVWTGTTPSGAISTGQTCGSWASSAGTGVMGLARSTNGSWTSGCSGVACTSTGAIYCVEQ